MCFVVRLITGLAVHGTKGGHEATRQAGSGQARTRGRLKFPVLALFELSNSVSLNIKKIHRAGRLFLFF